MRDFENDSKFKIGGKKTRAIIYLSIIVIAAIFMYTNRNKIFYGADTWWPSSTPRITSPLPTATGTGSITLSPSNGAVFIPPSAPKKDPVACLIDPAFDTSLNTIGKESSKKASAISLDTPLKETWANIQKMQPLALTKEQADRYLSGGMSTEELGRIVGNTFIASLVTAAEPLQVQANQISKTVSDILATFSYAKIPNGFAITKPLSYTMANKDNTSLSLSIAPTFNGSSIGAPINVVLNAYSAGSFSLNASYATCLTTNGSLSANGKDSVYFNAELQDKNGNAFVKYNGELTAGISYSKRF